MVKATTRLKLILLVLALMLFGIATLIRAQTPSTTTAVTSTSVTARDPGVRGGPDGAGGPINGLTARQFEFFTDGKADFEEVEVVADGLGARMNLDSCAGCHAQPTTGGTSPFVNPQVAFASKDGGTDRVPFFITLNGPVREARFKFNPDGTRDGGVHNTATITGRTGAAGCVLAQPDFDTQATNNNLIFRIPTPVFGVGLIEQIPDSVIMANQAANASSKQQLGIAGHPNLFVSGRAITGRMNNNGNDGTIARFGWKAQNQTLLLFSGEAYNVEMGITNELFQQEREQNPNCQFATVPNDVTDTEVTTTPAGLNAIEKFAFFQRFLAPPTPSPDTPGGASSISNGRSLFVSTGCALCHTPTLTTGNSTVAALRNQPVNLFSDLLLHAMGPGLADNIFQGGAQGDEFRTAPLWGLGQRIFFLHDGRTTDLLQAIQAHKSAGDSTFGPSQANAVTDNFNKLSEKKKQDLLNFLRSL
ncbi:MAG: thiol oxidoreductase [Candidatus Rokuibacteriota bacterium]|nr:MAG: thiol oxidoreductase [Candidatus Rokubacteria bacterium]